MNTLLDLETQELLTRLPSNIDDDIPIINLAVSRNGYILSNDNFNNHVTSGKITTSFRSERVIKCYPVQNELVLILPDNFQGEILPGSGAIDV